jgi:uncharacterized repeat protein (TIGR04138 family)
MKKIGFAEALDFVVKTDARYDREAYGFLRDALDFTLKQKKKNKEEISRHVSGQELLEGVRQFAVREFGPMVLTVFEYWGIRACEDVGEMVFNLIEAGVFGRSERDSREDFKNGYDFRQAFVEPFLPEKKSAPGKAVVQRPAEKSK